MTEFYADGQLRTMARMMKGEVPSWFILCGPADGNEAQTAVKEWPGVKVYGIEPNKYAVDFQLANGWPGNYLFNGAVMDYTGYCQIYGISPDDLRHGRAPEGDEKGGEVPCWQLDRLDVGIWKRALLWMDIEGSEAKALRGAELLLSRGVVWWVSVETSTALPDVLAEVEATLTRHGFERVGVWHDSGGPYKDTLWRLADAKRASISS